MAVDLIGTDGATGDGAPELGFSTRLAKVAGAFIHDPCRDDHGVSRFLFPRSLAPLFARDIILAKSET